MIVSWKRFNIIASERNWTPEFQGYEGLFTTKGNYIKEVWTFKENNKIEALKLKHRSKAGGKP